MSKGTQERRRRHRAERRLFDLWFAIRLRPFRPQAAPFPLYNAALDYTGKTDVLVSSSAAMVHEIAGFWRNYFVFEGWLGPSSLLRTSDS
jgi:hypothetical protein